MASGELNKSQRNGKIVLITTWQHTKEMSPAFGRLMALLLKRKSRSNSKALIEDNRRTDGQHQL